MINTLSIIAATGSGEPKLNTPRVPLQDLVENGMSLALWGIGIMAVIVIIYSALQIVTARGDVEKATKGRRTIVWGIVGLVIVLLAGAIISVVANTAGEV